MDVANVSPASVSASQQAMTQEAAGVAVLRKVMDIEATQGAMLVQMMNQAAGVGRNLDVQV